MAHAESECFPVSENRNTPPRTVVQQNTPKTKRKPSEGGSGIPKRVRNTNKLGKIKSITTVRKPNTARKRKESYTQPPTTPCTSQIHRTNRVDQSPALVWKYRWLIVEPTVLKSSAVWNSNFDRCLSEGHAQVHPGSSQMVNVQMYLDPEAPTNKNVLMTGAGAATQTWLWNKDIPER